MEKKKVLLLIDIQQEYVSEGRPFFISTISPSLKNAKKVLETARAESWEILHVQHLQDGAIFHPDSQYSNFIPGFEPKNNEFIFTKENFSCFSDLVFSNHMEPLIDYEIFVIGYGSTMCCMATIIDGYHRGFRFTFVQDASHSKRSAQFSEVVRHIHAVDQLRTFANITNTADISVTIGKFENEK
ncbi:isochorismatase family protein [Bacillus sp. FSL K6-0268]|uniref:isochorismatase family protein n=1 Tax=Bacillus sp. FSL K6-0268 TaxID=2921449 RepID=UPI0030F8EB33